MSNFGKRVDRPGGRRRIKRRPVHIQASATSGEGSKAVVVEDLCLIGARLVGSDLPLPGEVILLQSRERAIHGRVTWANEDRRGIVFGALPKAA